MLRLPGHRTVVVLALTLSLAGCAGGEPEAEPQPSTVPTTQPSPPPPPPPPTTEQPPPPPPPPYSGPLRFPAGAGAFVWHETDIGPETLAQTLLESGFDWAALRMHDGLTEDPVEGDWINRYRRAGGPPLGGWGVLRTEAEAEAQLAHTLVTTHELTFYVANAEAEYAFTGPDGRSEERYGRSLRFVRAFRALLPDLPTAVSSYCRADRTDLDWAAWRDAGFHFLPQAYVNDFGQSVLPKVCVRAAAGVFESAQVHPTIGSYPSRYPVSADAYARMLGRDGSPGFSVYLAEVAMPAEAWLALGAVD